MTQAAAIPTVEHVPDPVAITTASVKACEDITLTTRNTIGSSLARPRSTHAHKIVSIARTQQILMDIQMHLNDFLCSLVSSLNSSVNSLEETPLRQLFQEIHKEIAVLWIQNPRFDFIRHETKNPCTSFLFEELAAYWEHSQNVYIHDSGSYSEIQSSTSIPLVFEGDTVGFFSFSKEKNTHLSGIKSVETMVASIMNMVQILVIFLKTREQVGTDSLTGIANRWAVLEKAKMLFHMSIRQDARIGFYMIDLDYFKSINDLYWHPMGDQVLIAVSKALWTALRPEDALGRYGGEEFIVIANGGGEQDCITIANRLLEAVRTVCVPTETAWQTIIRPTCSIWVHIWKPSGDTSSGDFIDLGIISADWALYRAKKGGRNQFVNSSSAQTLASSPQITEKNTSPSIQDAQ